MANNEKMPGTEAKEAVEKSAPVTPQFGGVPGGLDMGNPAAQQALNEYGRSAGYIARSGIMGAAAGATAGQNAAHPLTAFIQGMGAGVQMNAQLYEQKRAQIQSVVDATPFASTHPELAAPGKPYELLGGMPTALAMKVLQQAAIDTHKVITESQARIGEEQAKLGIGTIKNIGEAAPYARMANESYGLTGSEAIRPEELIGMRREDVDNMLRVRTGKVAPEANTQLTDVMETAPGELAAQYGLPSQRVNPYHKMPEKVYEKVKAANAVLANKVIDKSQATVDSMANAVNSLQRAKSLIDSGLQTGPISGRIPGRKLGAEAQEFDQIASTILPSMRQGMPGAVSDRDMAIFKDANFGLTKTEEVNKKIINQQLAVATRVKDKAEFLSNWATVYGDMSGAEANWAKYVKENPLFTATGDINANVKTYQEYFDRTSGRATDGWDEAKEARYQALKAKMGAK